MVTHDERVDYIIDVLSDVRWIAVVENQYEIKQVYPDPPEREPLGQIMHLTNSDKHPIAYCGKDITLEDMETEYVEHGLDIDLMSLDHYDNCKLCSKAFLTLKPRIYGE